MRRQGLADSPTDLGPNGHACWGYHDLDSDFLDAAVAFVHEGVELGQALMFVGGPEAEEVVRSVDPFSSMIADGLLTVAPFEAVYPGGRRMPNAGQWAAYSGATVQAIEKGATGLRVLAEVTSLASPQGAWPGHARWESYADRRMAGTTLSALCLFDRTVLPPEALGAIACAHPVVDRRLEPLVPFRLFGRRGSVAVAGEVDAFSSETLRRLLDAGDGWSGDRVLDLDDLSFIDHTGVWALHEYAEGVRAQGQELTVRGGPPTLRKLADILGVTL